MPWPIHASVYYGALRWWRHEPMRKGTWVGVGGVGRGHTPRDAARGVYMRIHLQGWEVGKLHWGAAGQASVMGHQSDWWCRAAVTVAL